MNRFNDHYQTLGVDRGAAPAAIAAAYRALVRQYHPDLHPGDWGAEERLKQINAAYEVLSDAAARRAYDRLWDLRQAAPSPAARPASSWQAARPAPSPGPAAPPQPRRPWFVAPLLILVLAGVLHGGSGHGAAPGAHPSPHLIGVAPAISRDHSRRHRTEHRQAGAQRRGHDIQR
jgi:curved DNA-binding protein CbpA